MAPESWERSTMLSTPDRDTADGVVAPGERLPRKTEVAAPVPAQEAAARCWACDARSSASAPGTAAEPPDRPEQVGGVPCARSRGHLKRPLLFSGGGGDIRAEAAGAPRPLGDRRLSPSDNRMPARIARSGTRCVSSAWPERPLVAREVTGSTPVRIANSRLGCEPRAGVPKNGPAIFALAKGSTPAFGQPTPVAPW